LPYGDTGRIFYTRPRKYENPKGEPKMKKNLAKTYNPKEFEDRIYAEWESSGAFIAERIQKKPLPL
jgi:hypothetical protein